jgi:hypothetical protein
MKLALEPKIPEIGSLDTALSLGFWYLVSYCLCCSCCMITPELSALDEALSGSCVNNAGHFLGQSTGGISTLEDESSATPSQGC